MRFRYNYLSISFHVIARYLILSYFYFPTPTNEILLPLLLPNSKVTIILGPKLILSSSKIVPLTYTSFNGFLAQEELGGHHDHFKSDSWNHGCFWELFTSDKFPLDCDDHIVSTLSPLSCFHADTPCFLSTETSLGEFSSTFRNLFLKIKSINDFPLYWIPFMSTGSPCPSLQSWIFTGK